jgi:hypothetical protein
MSRWFRFYAEALDDPKVQKLDGDTFKAWVNLLCVAARNDGFLPSVDDVAFSLRMTADGARTLLERLLNATLIDKCSGGADGYRYAPHGWHERQYKSDTSTDRVKRFRQRSKPVPETPPETDTDTDSSVDKSTGGAAADPVKELFDVGVSVLTSAGSTEKQARSLIGKWRKDNSDGEVLTALIDCRTRAIAEPVEWLTKRFSGTEYVSASGYRYRGDDRAVMREAEKRADWSIYWKAKGNMDRGAPQAGGVESLGATARIAATVHGISRHDPHIKQPEG